MSSVVAGMNARERVLELVECGLVDPMYALRACLGYMSLDEVDDMIRCNDMEADYDEE